MKISLNWLQKYIDLNLSPQQIAKKLTFAGIEVENIETIALGLNRIVVGSVTKVEKHPSADKLCVATVSTGSESFQVVCGAPNCRPGIKVAFAMEGATLRDQDGKSTSIKRTTIRGVESFGMLCSSRELRIGDDHDGIIELSQDIQEGTDVATLFEDTIFEVGLTPNIGHCASIIGVARELSASTGLPIRYPEIKIFQENNNDIKEYITVKVEDSKQTPRYACRLIKNIQVGPSPTWLQRRLISCGLRPINNVVDITNYVVLEMGQPLHAFDYQTLEGAAIIVRGAKEKERFTTLDGKERELSEGDILICDQKKPVALAGIMGGQNSEVTEKTVDVLLEAAVFHPGTIRKTSKRLGLTTDAAKRFERQVDPNQTCTALDYAATMIQELANGQICEGVIDIKAGNFPEKKATCRLSRINHVLGMQFSVSGVERIFQRLGMNYHWDNQDVFTVSIPTYRADISQEIDLIEEVARIYGFENIEKSPARYQASSLNHAPIFLFEREVSSRLVANGLQQFLTCDLIGPSICNIVNDTTIPPEALIHVLNPTSIEQSILRTSLLPGLLQVVKYNIDHQNRDISGFEIGRTHFKEEDNYKEQAVAAIILTGSRNPYHWDKKSESVDFFDLKGIVENLLSLLNVDDVIFKPSSFSTLHSGRQASIFVGELEIGSLGEVHPSIQRRLDVSQPIYYAELSLNDLLQVRKTMQLMEELPIYPASERDWTLTIPETITLQQLLTAIREVGSPLLEEVSLKDIYRSDKLEAGMQNVTLHFVYRDRTKTVEQPIVDAEHDRIITNVNAIVQSYATG